MPETIAPLARAVRPKVVGKYVGQLLLVVAGLTLIPLLAALGFADTESALRYLLVIALMAALGLPTLRLSVPAQLQVNEALTITALAFVITPLMMAYPLMAAGLSYTDALFEAVSGITTTGLTTLANVHEMPQSFWFARAWMQWYGGLGIVVLSTALLMGHHIVARRLAEPLTSETMLTTTRTHARQVIGVYVSLTTLGFAVLWLIQGDALIALIHTLAAVSTGGFSTFNNSLGGLGGWSERYIVMTFSFCGAVPLILYYRAVRHHWTELFTDIEFRALLIACVLVAGLVIIFLHFQSGFDWHDSFAHGVLLGVSAQSTTGFSSLDIGSLDWPSLLVLIGAMITGAGIGSSAGGYKLLRLLIVVQLIRGIIHRTALPEHAVAHKEIAGKVLADNEIERALLIILLFFGVVTVSWLIFVAYGCSPLPALFDVVSAVGTVGLSTGITRDELPTVLKMVLCADMLLGRLEIVALLVVLYPGTWLGRHAESQ